jgi:hypothetical protein
MPASSQKKPKYMPSICPCSSNSESSICAPKKTENTTAGSAADFALRMTRAFMPTINIISITVIKINIFVAPFYGCAADRYFIF